jgi:hypothetical protein
MLISFMAAGTICSNHFQRLSLERALAQEMLVQEPWSDYLPVMQSAGGKIIGSLC